MEFKNENGTTVQNGNTKEINNKAHQNGEAKKENGNLPKKENANGNGKAEAEKVKPTPVKEEKPETVKPEQPKAEEPKKEEPKAEAVQVKEEVKPVRVVLNLEGTLKVVEDLHRRGIQRINLITRMKQLETFEVNLATENDELEDNPYQGCKLIIEDDKQRRFITTTPGLIRMVSQFIFDACQEKLMEIEANIIFPNA